MNRRTFLQVAPVPLLSGLTEFDPPEYYEILLDEVREYIFDAYAKPGELTRRLIAMAKSAFPERLGVQPTHCVLPFSVHNPGTNMSLQFKKRQDLDEGGRLSLYRKAIGVLIHKEDRLFGIMYEEKKMKSFLLSF